MPDDFSPVIPASVSYNGEPNTQEFLSVRIAGLAKGGYFPVEPGAVSFLSQFIKPPDPLAPFTMLDPCAGRGEAIRQWSEILGCPQDRVYAIELEDDRSAAVRELMPAANVLGPCSAMGCRVLSGSFPFIWLNPPFDDALGGGARVELQFLDRATYWLKPGGVMCLICPAKVADLESVRQYLRCAYDRVCIVPFPNEFRPYNEVAVIATRRKRTVPPEKAMWADVYQRVPSEFHILPSERCGIFEQTQFTDDQLRQALKESPLRRLLSEPPVRTIPRPPLELSHGHIALLLASGHIDGIVCPDGEQPHVVRGVSRKTEYLKDVEEKDDETSTEVYSERIEMIVRTVDVHGTIKTFGSGQAQQGASA